MKNQTILTFEQAGEVFRVEVATIVEFADYGLFPTVESPLGPGIAPEILELLERVLSLHQVLGINKEGIDVVLRLGDRVRSLQRELEDLEADREFWRGRASALQER
jgi:hypothetical protein